MRPGGPDPSGEQLAGLQDRLAELVLATPGVARLDPTFRAALRHLGRPARGDGVDLVHHGQTTDVDVSLTTRSSRTARTLCRQIRTDIGTAVLAAGLVPGTIEISVVAVEASTR